MNPTLVRVAMAIVILAGVAAILRPATLFVVDQREMAVVLRFGNPVRTATDPGLYWKMPLTEEVRRLPATKQLWGGTPQDVLADLPTQDDKKIELVAWAIWRINDPAVFVQRLRTEANADSRVGQFVRAAVRDVVTTYPLAELVRSTDRTMRTGRDDLDPVSLDVALEGEELLIGDDASEMTIRTGRRRILEEIRQRAQRRLRDADGADGAGVARGIELVEIGISQIDFVPSVREKTFDRWIAEREAISARNVNEGERLKQEIVNRAKAEAEQLLGDGRGQSNQLRGAVDAEVIQKYAEAVQTMGEFFTFVRTLEAYEKAIDRDSRLILSSESQFFRLLNRLEPPTTTP